MPRFGEYFLDLTEPRPRVPPNSSENFYTVVSNAEYQGCPCTCQCGCPCSGSPRKNSDAMSHTRGFDAVSEPLPAAALSDDAMSTNSASSRQGSVKGEEGAQYEISVEAGDLGWHSLRDIGRMLDRTRDQTRQLLSILPNNCNLPPPAYVSPNRSAIWSPISMSVETCSSGPRSMESSISQLSLPPLGSPALVGMGAGAVEPPHQQVMPFVHVSVAIHPHDSNHTARESRAQPCHSHNDHLVEFSAI